MFCGEAAFSLLSIWPKIKLQIFNIIYVNIL